MLRFLLLITFLLSWAHAQEDLHAPVALLSSGGETGAAILVGQRSNQLYFLTAAHVILDPQDLQLQFVSRQTASAVMVDSDGDLDLAAIRCEIPQGMTVPPSFSFGSEGFGVDEEVIVIGHPLGNKWDLNRANKVKESNYGVFPGRFTLYPMGIGPGSSGGAILNKRQELLGMVSELDQINTVCIHIDILKKACSKWSVPMNLMLGIGKTSPNSGEIVNQPESPSSYTDPWAGEMIWIKGGSFMMGSEEGRGNEKPIHRVNIKSFYMGIYEVTVSEFVVFVAETKYKTDAEEGDGSYIWKDGSWEKKEGINWRHDAKGDLRPQSEHDHPVIHVSWNDAQAYIKWLNGKTKNTYRLPTEAEWEYAAGNGSTHTKYSWGDAGPSGKNGGNVADEKAKESNPDWTIFSGYNDGHLYTAPVGQFNPNSFGLYDMTGNVWEWCQDWYHSSYKNAPKDGSAGENPTGSNRVMRGGSWYYNPALCRVANRLSFTPDFRSFNVGFRLARTL